MADNKWKEVLEALKPEERKEVLSILKDFKSGNSSKRFKDMLLKDYEEIPVDVSTFINNNKYLGKSFEPDESIYPFWQEELKKIFNNARIDNYNEILITGAIGIGKTTVSTIIVAYVLYQIMCLKNPQKYYGLMSNSEIIFMFFNITLDMSESGIFKKLNEMLLKSAWFLERGEESGRVHKHYIPRNNIKFKIGSKASHGLGKNIFCLDGETEVGVYKKQTNELESMKLNELVNPMVQLFNYDIENDKVDLSSKNHNAIIAKEEQELIKVTLEDGTVVLGSADHKLLLEDGTYKDIEKLKPGDRLKSLDKKQVEKKIKGDE